MFQTISSINVIVDMKLLEHVQRITFASYKKFDKFYASDKFKNTIHLHKIISYLNFS